MNSLIRHLAALSMFTLVVPTAMVTLSGCDDDETVLDVETPEGDLEVERDLDTGEVEIDD